jgi:DNA-binding winged helix-turn-helix (wHTH) protein/Tol biopolymer transport system component
MRLKSQRFEFGPFRLEPANHLLTREGTPVQLAPKAFDILACLVQSTGKLVTTDELMKAVWPDSFVEEGNVSVYISQIRKALGSADAKTFIETVPRRGYRFKAEVHVVEEDELRAIPPVPLVLPSAKAAAATARADTASFLPRREADTEGLEEVRGNHIVVRQTHRPELVAIPARKSQETAAPAEPAQSAQRRSPKLDWHVAAGLACVAILAVLGWLLIRRGIRPAAPLQQTRLTSFAPELAVTAAAISAGAKFIAYSNPDGLFIQVISSGDTSPLALPEPHFEISRISWFPDSARLLVAGSGPADAMPGLWTVPVIGSAAPVKLGPYRSGAVSPDGAEIAFEGMVGDAPELEIMSSQGGPARLLVKGSLGETFGNVNWYSDGHRLIFVRYRWNPQFRGNVGSIESYDLNRGKIVHLLSGTDFGGDALILPDGRVVYTLLPRANPVSFGGELMEARTDPQSGRIVGAQTVLARWSSRITDLSANDSGSQIALRDSVVGQCVFVGRVSASGENMVGVHRLTFGSGRDDIARAWSPDSKSIFFDSNRSGHWQIYKITPATGIEEPFVQSPDDDLFGPRMSPGGGWLLYIDRARNWRAPQPARVMRVSITGGAPEPVLQASGFTDWHLRFRCPHRAGMPCLLARRQGDEITFRAFDPVNGFENGGKPIARVNGGHFEDWSVAPGGGSLAWVNQDSTDDQVHVLRLAETAAGLRVVGSERYVNVEAGALLRSIAWSADGKEWFIARQQPASWTLLRVSFDGRASAMLTDRATFAPDTFPSPDGRFLAFTEERANSNVWLLRNF